MTLPSLPSLPFLFLFQALRFLKLNWTDVRKAQECRQPLDKEVFVVDKESWNKICQSHPQLMRPSRQRPEIVLQDASSPDLDNYTEISKKKSSRRFIELKFGFSVFSFIREKELRTDEREQVSSVENIEEHEEYEEEITNPMFMSNIREEVAVNRIRLNFVSKKMKGNAYAKLYKEEYMSVIGPEVFDRATKLPKVTCPVTPEVRQTYFCRHPTILKLLTRPQKLLLVNCYRIQSQRVPCLLPTMSLMYPARK